MIRRRSRSSRRMLPTKRSAIALARGARTGVRMMRTLLAVTTASKAAVNVASRSRMRNRTRRPASSRSMRRFAGLLGQPGCGGVGGDAEGVHAAGGVLDDEEDIQPAQGDRLKVEQVEARIECAWARRNSVHDGPARRGEGAMPAL